MIVLVSFLMAVVAGVWFGLRRRPKFVFRPGQMVRVRFEGHVARTRLLYWSRDCFAIEPPLSRDGPVFEGTGSAGSAILEIAQPAGVAIVRAAVRCVGPVVEFEAPTSVRLWDRRVVKRNAVDTNVMIEGEVGRMVDVSEQGCRVVTSASVSRGERLAVDVPGRGRLFGWALATGDGFVRLRFEEPYPL